MAEVLLPFEILESHSDERGVILCVKTFLSGMETIVVYPGANMADVYSGRILTERKSFITLPNSEVSRHIAMNLLDLWIETEKRIDKGESLNTVFNGGGLQC